MADKSKGNPLDYTPHIRTDLADFAERLRDNIKRMDDPSAKALFETSAEVLLGLKKAFEDYEKKNEPAWQNN